MVFNDRLKRALFALFKASVPRLDYYTTYSAKVVIQSGDLFDLQPDDARIPPMGGIPIRHGLPGVTIRIPPGSTVLVGWENGDPSRPFCALWQGGEGNVTRITIVADTIELGGSGLDPIRDGLVHGSGISDYSGLPYWQLGNTSSVVRGKK